MAFAHKNGAGKAVASDGGELRGDETWKKIQQNTFTRWANQQLRVTGVSVSDLEMDLCDGILLIKLAEVLSGKRLQRYNKNPIMRTQMLDNISQALKFFQDDEGVKIVNIDSMHIVDRNLKLILGLIYTLIMHYSIAKATLGDTTDERETKESPKRRLLAWIKSRLPNDVPVTNFTSDWNDGVALGALIDTCAPRSCPNWRSWQPDNALENTHHAMKAAERILGIADLITPEELINPNVDEKSVMTYLSQFPQARLQAQGQLSGVDASPMVGRRAEFGVDLTSAEMQPQVEITNLHGDALPVEIKPNLAFASRFDVSYVPEQVGIHKITVTAVTTSPFDDKQASVESGIKVADATVNAVPAAQLLGLSARTELGEEERFRVTNIADGRQLNIVVVDADGREFEVVPSVRVGNTSVCSYRPDSIGLHSLNVFVDRRHIPGSPFPVRVVNKATDKVVVWGRGIHAEGTCSGDEMPVHVDACNKPVNVSVTTKEGLLVPVSTKFSHLNFTPSAAKDSRQKPGHSGRSDLRNRRQTFVYVPRSAGAYHVEVRSVDGAHLGKSPYEVKVGPRNRLNIRAVGPGIEGGVKNRKSCFYIDTFGGANSLEFSIEGPNETQIACRDNGDSSAVVDYTPVSSGLYVVNVLNNGEHIKDSPFVLAIDSDDEDDEKKALKGSAKSSESKSSIGSTSSLTSTRSQPDVPVNGLDSNTDNDSNNEGGIKRKRGFYVGQPVEFTVGDVDKPVDQLLDVVVYGPDLIEIPLTHSGKYSERVRFVPEKPGKHVVSVCRDGVAVREWPYTVNVKAPLELSRLSVYGPGVGAGNIFVGQRTSFTIDSRRVGSDAVGVSVHDPDGKLLQDVTLSQESNPGLHTVDYMPQMEGPHRINVYVDSELTFDIKVWVEPKRSSTYEDAPNANGVVKQTSQRTIEISDNKQQQQQMHQQRLELEQQKIRAQNEQQLKQSVQSEQKQQQHQLDETNAPNILKREKDINETDSSVRKSGSLCDVAIFNREGSNQAPERYQDQQQYLMDGAEHIGSSRPLAIGLDYLGSDTLEAERTQDKDESRLSVRYAPEQSSNVEKATPATLASITVTCEHPIRLVDDFDKIQETRTSTTYKKPPLEPSPAQLSVAAIPKTVVGHNTSLYLKHYPVHRTTRLSAWIEAPNGGDLRRILIERITSPIPTANGGEENGDQYRVDFVPNVEGMHLISVKDEANGDKEIEGSPFHISVYALGADDAHLVTAHGAGLMTGEAGRLEKFRVTLPPTGVGTDGGGEVSVTVDGPSRAEITLIREDEGKKESEGSACRVEYRIDEPGLYYFDVCFNNTPIANSPFKVYIKPRNDTNRSEARTISPYSKPTSSYDKPAKYVRYEDDEIKKVAPESSLLKKERQMSPSLEFGGKPHRVLTRGAGLIGYNLGEAATFQVDTSNAGVDLLFVGVVTLNEPCDEVFIRYMGNGLYEVEYCIRKISSKAVIIVKYSDRQIPGSPFTAYPRRTNA